MVVQSNVKSKCRARHELLGPQQRGHRAGSRKKMGTDTPPGMVSVRKANAVRATSFSARSRCAISGAQEPTALIGSLQLRVLGPLKLCVVSGGGQAEKAQKADAALRAAIANTTAGRGVSDSRGW